MIAAGPHGEICSLIATEIALKCTLVIDKIEKVSAKFVSKSDLIWDYILAENERVIDKSMYFHVDSNLVCMGIMYTKSQISVGTRHQLIVLFNYKHHKSKFLGS